MPCTTAFARAVVAIACLAGADLASIRLGDRVPAMKSETRLKQDIIAKRSTSLHRGHKAVISRIHSKSEDGCTRPLSSTYNLTRSCFSCKTPTPDFNRGDKGLHSDPREGLRVGRRCAKLTLDTPPNGCEPLSSPVHEMQVVPLGRRTTPGSSWLTLSPEIHILRRRRLLLQGTRAPSYRWWTHLDRVPSPE